MPTPRPSSYLNWIPSGNPLYIQQPSGGQLTTGWTALEAPPFQYANWLEYTIDQWIQYLDQTVTGGGGVLTASALVQTTTASITIGSTAITAIANTTNVQEGQVVVGTGIPAGTYLVSLSGSAGVMSAKATSNQVAEAVTFSHRYALGATIQRQLDQLDGALTHIADLYDSAFIGGAAPESGGSSPYQLASTHRRWQVFTPSVGDVVKLPNDVPQGDVWRLTNLAANATLSLETSTGALITLLPQGTIELAANTANPTTAANWKILRAVEFYQYALAYVGGATPESGGSSPFQLDTGMHREQVFTPPAAEIIKLPAAAAQGETWKIVNLGLFALTVQASDGTVVKQAVVNGSIELVALVANPTTSTNWRVVLPQEIPLYTIAFVGTLPEDVPLNVADNRHQLYSPSVPFALTLPSTGIVQGDTWKISNTSIANAIDVRSSSGATLTLLVGGSAEFVAKIATPTLASHWAVVEPQDIGLLSRAFVGTAAPQPGGSSPFTLTSADRRFQLFTPTAAGIVQLPMDNILMGEVWRIYNAATNHAITVQSASGGTLDVAIGGYVEVVAMIDAPNNPGDWYVADVVSDNVPWIPVFALTTPGTGSSRSGTAFYSRRNSEIRVGGTATFTALGTGSGNVFLTGLPFAINIDNSSGVAIASVSNADPAFTPANFPTGLIAGTSIFLLHGNTDGGGNFYLLGAGDIRNGYNITFSGSYFK